MSVLTPWGYEITDTDTLPNLLTVEEFGSFTAGKFAGDARIDSEIGAVSQAIRNYAGWHLAGPHACRFVCRANNKAITSVGSDLLIQLPARYVSAVSCVLVNATESNGVYSGAEPEYDVNTNGIIRIYDAECVSRKTLIVVEYTAGIPDTMAMSIRELVAHRITRALSSSYGVQSEAAGGVSVTYSASWSGSGATSSITDDAKDILSPYRLQGVF